MKLPRSPLARRALLGGVGLLVVLGAIVLRVHLASHAALERGISLANDGQPEQAALAFREAIAWYHPGNGAVTEAIERMWALANEAEQRGELVRARVIVGELRGALYAIRHVTQPHEESVRLCDRRLAHLLARTDERVLRGDKTVEEVQPEFEAATARDHAPSVPWSLALGLGFLVWVGATVMALRRLVPAEAGGSWALRPALPWLVLALLALATWLAGAALA